MIQIEIILIREFYKVTELSITGFNYGMSIFINIIGCIFLDTKLYIIFVVGELNWVDVINNYQNELSDNEKSYVNSNDTSFTDDDKKRVL